MKKAFENVRRIRKCKNFFYIYGLIQVIISQETILSNLLPSPLFPTKKLVFLHLPPIIPLSLSIHHWPYVVTSTPLLFYHCSIGASEIQLEVP